MIKVLIVDDEKLVRQSIKNRVNWERISCEIIGEADNGICALEFLDTHYVDVVITDIKMPVMDGIEMIRQATKLYTNIQFIILSGFPDFQYAKIAMTLGVKNFIEKPIDIKELEKTLIEISHHQRLTYTELVEKSEEYFKENDVLFMAVMQLNINNHLLLTECGLEEKLKTERIYYFIDSHFPKCQFLLFHATNTPEELHQIFINTALLKVNKSEFYIFSATNDANDIVSMHYCIVNQLKHKVFVFDEAKKIDFDEQKSRIAAMKSCISGNKKKSFFTIFDDLFENHNQISCDIVELFMYEMCTEIRKKYDSIKMVSLIQEVSSPYFIAGFFSFYQLKTRLFEIFNLVFNNISETENDDSIIMQICKYIKLNLATELSLELISSEYFISSTYLSTLFHKKVGTTIKRYIEDLRIEQAKGLLNNFELSINDVSNLVGYNDPNYFSKVFKKNTGMSPSHYQQLLDDR